MVLNFDTKAYKIKQVIKTKPHPNTGKMLALVEFNAKYERVNQISGLALTNFRKGKWNNWIQPTLDERIKEAERNFSKPDVEDDFDLEAITGVDSNGRYRVLYALTWLDQSDVEKHYPTSWAKFKAKKSEAKDADVYEFKDDEPNNKIREPLKLKSRVRL